MPADHNQAKHTTLLITMILGVLTLPLDGIYPQNRSSIAPKSPVDLRSVIRSFDSSKDIALRRSLILDLGCLDSLELPLDKRQLLIPRLLHLYRTDPDHGIHAAINWLLGHKNQGDKPRQLDWGQSHLLSEIDLEISGQPDQERTWFVNSLGQTMAIVSGPVEFLMGSPVNEVGRSDNEIQHRVRISRSFAISAREITVVDFRKFLEANPSIKANHAYPGNPGRIADVHGRFSPDDDGPAIAMTWYEAAAYCNWLSKMEGLPDSELVYPANLNDIRVGMTMPPDYLRRLGYRLPTEAEWEYAARAGTTTSRFFGETETPLKEYAWFSLNPPATKSDPIDPSDPQRTWPVGQLKPNQFGLFDIYGNVWEWVQDRRQDYNATGPEDIEDSLRVVRDSVSRVRRGGSFAYGSSVMRSAHRGATNYFPMQRRDNVGFRLAKTIRP